MPGHGWQLPKPLMSAWFAAKGSRWLHGLPHEQGTFSAGQRWLLDRQRAPRTRSGIWAVPSLCMPANKAKMGFRVLWLLYSSPFLTVSLSETLGSSKGGRLESWYYLSAALSPTKPWGGQR